MEHNHNRKKSCKKNYDSDKCVSRYKSKIINGRFPF